MAACVQTTEPSLKDEQITIDLIKKDDTEQVLSLLKRTFFQVKTKQKSLWIYSFSEMGNFSDTSTFKRTLTRVNIFQFKMICDTACVPNFTTVYPYL